MASGLESGWRESDVYRMIRGREKEKSMPLATTIMAKKKVAKPAPEPAKKRLGRPKGSGRVTSRYAIVATQEYKEWMEEFLKHVDELEVFDVFREGIKRYAEATGFRPPPKR